MQIFFAVFLGYLAARVTEWLIIAVFRHYIIPFNEWLRRGKK